MARMIVRRSLSFLAAKGWIAPAPRSKPSRRTYMVIMNATAMNQKVSTSPSSGCLFLGLRPVIHLAHDQQDVEETHDEIHTRKSYEREEHIARGDLRRHALRGSKEAVGKPGLPPELGHEPSGGVGDK